VRYQLPVAVKRQNVGLVVIDSMASNYRAEFGHADKRQEKKNSEDSGRRTGRAMADRKSQLVQLGAFLRDLARTEQIAIVVSNQVADRLAPTYNSQPSTAPGITPDPLALDHQLRWFSGWGDHQHDVLGLKTPSLGLVWTNQIAARIALIKSEDGSREGKTKRWFRVVFASWTAPTSHKGVEYEITTAGIKASLDMAAAETK
jgi:DNA repair protein RAD57